MGIMNLSTKKIILDTAYELFSVNGYEGTSVRQLAKEADVNISLIGYYFGGKEGLYREVVNHRISEFSNNFVASVQDEKDVKKRIRRFSELLLSSLIESPSILTIITRELVTGKSNTAFVTAELVKNFMIIFNSFFTDSSLPDLLELDVTEMIFDIFMVIAPIYFYSIVKPLIDDNMLMDEHEIESFHSKLVDQAYEMGLKLYKSNTKGFTA